MLSLMEEPPHPTHFAVIFDARGKNFRCPPSHVSRLHRGQRCSCWPLSVAPSDGYAMLIGLLLVIHQSIEYILVHKLEYVAE